MCYYAVRELGLTATSLAKKIGLKQPAISISVSRGEKIAKDFKLNISKNYNLMDVPSALINK